MTLPLAYLLTSLMVVPTGAAPGTRPVPALRLTAPPVGPAPRHLGSAEDLAALCAALAPAERLRARGDALERGEAGARQETGRDEALLARYAITLPGAPLAFAPYDVAERRLALTEPALLPVPESGSRLWPTEERGLAVEVDAAGARRILDAQRAGRLGLELVFDLPDDATCGSDPRGRTFTLPVEPVDWRWADGQAVLARGGAGEDRPLASAAEGGRPRVAVERPLAGPAAAGRAVAARGAELERCYAAALAVDPGVDGVLVVELGGKVAVAADSTGDPELGACVRRALEAVSRSGGAGRAAVPIRFELLPRAAAGNGGR